MAAGRVSGEGSRLDLLALRLAYWSGGCAGRSLTRRLEAMPSFRSEP